MDCPHEKCTKCEHKTQCAKCGKQLCVPESTTPCLPHYCKDGKCHCLECWEPK